MIKPQYGRQNTINLLLSLLDNLENPNIVEVGMTRHIKNIFGDGHFTIILSWYLNEYNKGNLFSIDINPNCVDNCKNILNHYNIPLTRTTLINDDVFNTIDLLPNNIDVLYLDAWDYEKNDNIRRESEENHLKLFNLLLNKLNDSHIIIIDDILDLETYTGKGKLIIPYLLEHNYEIHPLSLVKDSKHPVYTLLFIKKEK